MTHGSIFSPMKKLFSLVCIHLITHKKYESPSLASKEVFSRTLHYKSSNVLEKITKNCVLPQGNIVP